MTSGWHYWLFEAEEGRLPLPVEGVDPKVFTSLEEAREVAGSVGRAVDIFRTPEEGGIFEFVETVGRDITVTPATVEVKAEVHSPSASTTDKAEQPDDLDDQQETTTVVKSLELRWNVEAPTKPHVRQLVFHQPAQKGEAYRVEALDEAGNVLASGMGEPVDAYLELWDEMKPPED